MRRLKELEIEEVSVVTEGANPEADIVLMKRSSGTEELKELTKQLSEQIERLSDIEVDKLVKKYELLGLDKEKLKRVLKWSEKEPEAREGFLKKCEQAMEAIKRSGVYEEVGKAGRVTESDVEERARQLMKRAPGMKWREALEAAYEKEEELI